jgi:hypothetical protein
MRGGIWSDFLRRKVWHPLLLSADMKTLSGLFPLASFIVMISGCQSLFQADYSLEKLNEGRLGDQVYFEDSASVFFAEHTNAFPDKELLWFTVLIGGPVEMHVHNMETDSIESIYRFKPQDIPLHTIACRQDITRIVKVVLIVDGREKCARMYPAWYPLPQNWTTQYTIEQP